MTNQIFDQLKNRIKNDPTSTKTNWYDGHKWEDTAGNWYGWESCGYIEYIFYAGEKWERRTDASGKPCDPVQVEVNRTRPTAKPRLRICDLLGCPQECRGCIYGFLSMGEDCPTFEDKDEAADVLEEMARLATEWASRLGA